MSLLSCRCSTSTVDKWSPQKDWRTLELVQATATSWIKVTEISTINKGAQIEFAFPAILTPW